MIHITFWTLLAIIIAYLLGSISTSIIISKLLKLPDPRKEGSGNPGTTNILRIAGKKPALVTLIGDILKGLIAVIVGRLLFQHGFNLSLVALFAIIGHIYPIFHKFKGGKGVATGLGAIFGLSPTLGLLVAVVWLVVALISRYASLASLVAAIFAAIMTLFVAKPSYFIGLVLMAVLVFWRHRENIQRLRAKTEGKLFHKKEKEASSAEAEDESSESKDE